jgi:hypothetical protein
MLNARHVLTYSAVIDLASAPEGTDCHKLCELVHRLGDKIVPGSSELIDIETVPALDSGLSIHAEP